MDGENSHTIWLQELDQKVRKAYADLLETAYARSETHKQANNSLEDAIRITHEVTLQFLRDRHIQGGTKWEYSE